MNTPTPPVRIKVTEVIGSNLCVSAEDGEALYGKLESALGTGRPVELDFSGVDLVISAFLNAAVGRLVEQRTPDEIHQLIDFTHLVDDDRELIDRVLENAVRYFENPSRFREALEMEDDDEE